MSDYDFLAAKNVLNRTRAATAPHLFETEAKRAARKLVETLVEHAQTFGYSVTGPAPAEGDVQTWIVATGRLRAAIVLDGPAVGVGPKPNEAQPLELACDPPLDLLVLGGETTSPDDPLRKSEAPLGLAQALARAFR